MIINQQHQSKAFDERIKFIILHNTEKDFQTSLDLLNEKVSAHYLISEKPVEIFQLVAEEKRAWHAGVSYWNNRSNLNDSSIGIEITHINGDKNQYSDKQIEAVIFLCQKIIAKYDIAPDCILGHCDIAPLRKTDPGGLFPWKKLYKNGIGAMVDDDKIADLEKTTLIPTTTELQQNLAKYGYKIKITHLFDEQTKMVLDAFRRHFCPDLIGKEIEKRSYTTLLALIEKYRNT